MDLNVRHKLPAALCWSMAGITAFFVAFGAGGYLAYGRDVANFITMVRHLFSGFAYLRRTTHAYIL